MSPPVFLKRPDRARLNGFIDGQRERLFSHAHPGATRSGPTGLGQRVAPGFDIDHYRIRIGRGDATFERGRAILERWGQFDLGWAEICFPDTPLEVGSTVGVLARVMGVWSLNISRVVYTIDDVDPTGARTFGFAYGTLPAHVESGEERFVIECGPDGEVSYEILAFSRPAAWPARLGRPVARRVQRRFARESQQRIVAEVRDNA